MDTPWAIPLRQTFAFGASYHSQPFFSKLGGGF